MLVDISQARTFRRPRKRQPEAAFQKSLVKTLAMVLHRDVMLFAVPNGGNRSALEAAILVGQGVVPGVPDLMVLWDGKGAGIECKAEGGRLTPNQKAVHERFARAGVPVAVVTDLHGALAFLKAQGVPFRIEVAV